jgi:hypothetical protein
MTTAATHETVFGRMLEVPAPDDANAMIVCINAGHGLKPVRLLLLHQLYEHVLQEILDANPGTEEVVCVPMRSEDYVSVWYRDDKRGL